MAETMDLMIEAGRLAPLLIAGVDHGLEARIAELTPRRCERPGEGGVAENGRFVMDDLVPYPTRAFGARTDAAGLGVGSGRRPFVGRVGTQAAGCAGVVICGSGGS